MPIKRVIADLKPDETIHINFIRALIAAEGGKVEQFTDADGLVTIIGTFPGQGGDLALPVPGTAAADWMAVARAEIGQKEVAGAGDNPRIVEYHATTQGGAEPDSVPWCSSFVNFCITRAGLGGSNSKLARSWLGWGQPLAGPLPGCIVVLSRGSDRTKGHVGFHVGDENGLFRLLGGNQGDAVNVASHQKDRLLGLRWPNGVPVPAG